MATYTVHGGHAESGRSFCGAVGYHSESTEDRKIKDAIIKYLTLAGHKAVDCTVNKGTSQSGIIVDIKKKINAVAGSKANISIHLNAFQKVAADGKAKGSECEVYALSGESYTVAKRILAKLGKLGFPTTRGVKARTDLGVLHGITNGGANVLVEVYFCDDQDDCKLADKIGVDAIGKAIAEGITGSDIISSSVKKTTTTTKDTSFKVKILVDSLNVRKKPNATAEVVTKCMKGSTYTIVETSGNWGMLKSGSGWINIGEKYVKKM